MCANLPPNLPNLNPHIHSDVRSTLLHSTPLHSILHCDDDDAIPFLTPFDCKRTDDERDFVLARVLLHRVLVLEMQAREVGRCCAFHHDIRL